MGAGGWWCQFGERERGETDRETDRETENERETKRAHKQQLLHDMQYTLCNLFVDQSTGTICCMQTTFLLVLRLQFTRTEKRTETK